LYAANTLSNSTQTLLVWVHGSFSFPSPTSTLPRIPRLVTRRPTRTSSSPVPVRSIPFHPSLLTFKVPPRRFILPLTFRAEHIVASSSSPFSFKVMGTRLSRHTGPEFPLPPPSGRRLKLVDHLESSPDRYFQSRV